MRNYDTGFISPYYSDYNAYKPTDMMYSRHLSIWGIFKKFITSEGVHCFSNKSTAYDLAKREACLSFHYSVLMCKIPKNALYYEGENNEVAAGKLKLLKVLDSFPTQENIEEAMRERELEQRKRLKGFGKKKKK